LIEDVLHFSFTVADIEASTHWYQEIVGLELIHRQPGDNDYTRTLVGIDDAAIEVAHLRVPEAHSGRFTPILELIQYVRPVADTHARPINNVGAAHLAFVVDDLSAEYDRLLAAGVDFVNPPVRITEGVNEGGSACYLRDPDGIALELLQRPGEPSPRTRG
jgi:catechol 2,3-dioxygenase-like lactoylglutathione lyase family enzyme